MIVVGIDAHKKTLTAVAVDPNGVELGVTTVAATAAGHLGLMRWVSRFGGACRFAVEDCRHLTGALERSLVGAGETVTRVPPSLMAGVRKSGRSPGKSDPIDALAVAGGAAGTGSAHRPSRRRRARGAAAG